MSITLHLSRVSESLQLGSDEQIPDAWLKLDVLSQGLVSRYLARERGAPKNSDATSSWVLLRPFSPESPALYGIWNSQAQLTKEQLAPLVEVASKCRLDKESLSVSEQDIVRSLWKEVEESGP
jgi:hypothetical protein